MDIQFYGANCITLSYKATRIVIDDNLSDLGAKSIVKAGDILLSTSKLIKQPAVDTKITIDDPGEYEVSDISIVGIPARSHIDEEKQHSTTMYKITLGDTNYLVTGHIHPQLDEEQLEIVGIVDVLLIPVGGHGLTLDPEGALTIIKELEPKLVIPTHYADNKITYSVPQVDLATAIKDLGMEPKETLNKLHLKPADLGDVTQLVVLARD